MALQIPMAAARSLARAKVLVSTASVAGKIRAAPMPMSARLAMSVSGVATDPARTDVATKAPSPVVSAFLRPQRSPTLPAARSRPVKTSR